MPLLAHTLDGTLLIAPRMNDAEWQALRASQPRDAFMAAGGRAIPKVSKLGTRFFAHSPGSAPPGGGESAEHLLMKAEVLAGATAAGWDALPEQAGLSPSGRAWRADVLCRRHPGSTRGVVFEAQVSTQSEEEYAARQAAYEESGLRAVWLVAAAEGAGRPSRSTPRFKVSITHTEEKVPVATVVVGQREVPLREFVRGALGSPTRLVWYGKKDEATVGLVLAPAYCWSHRCRGRCFLPCEVEADEYCSFDLDQGFRLPGFRAGFKALRLQAPTVLDRPRRYTYGLISRCPHCGCDYKYDRRDAREGSRIIVPIGVRVPAGMDTDIVGLKFHEPGWYWKGEEGWPPFGLPMPAACEELMRS
jgi:hypothetical protein